MTHSEGANTSDGAHSSLSRKLDRLTSTEPESCIFRVHKHLREVNKEAYEPEIIAIGPYHRNKENVLMMEEHKLRYLRSMLQLENQSLERYLIAVKSLEQKVRDFYAERLSLSSDELAEMMVLDGCFIIQLMLKDSRRSSRDQNDPIFRLAWLLGSLKRDLMLFENQIPFFILNELLGMIGIVDERTFIFLLMDFFKGLLPDPSSRWALHQNAESQGNHLLELIHIYWQPFLDSIGNRDVNDNKDIPDMPCAVELREAGVKFKRKETTNFFDITFENGILQIPPFSIEDRTGSFLRNLIAYEQYCGSRCPTYVIDYVRFLDCLINSSADVEILHRYGILQNFLGDNEVVASLFNRITDSVVSNFDDLRYAGTFKIVKGYCNKRRNRWMAKLRRNYFNSPWGVISIAAASVLLLLSLIQTVFTVLK